MNVKWATATETNCDYFTVWKIENNGSKIPLGKVIGHGTASVISEYQFADVAPVSGMNYYQISQTDFSGEITWSEIAGVSFTHSATVTCWYHGTDQVLHLQRNTDHPAIITITDLTGRILSKQEVNSKNAEIDIAQGLQGQIVLVLIDDSNGDRAVVKTPLY